MEASNPLEEPPMPTIGNFHFCLCWHLGGQRPATLCAATFFEFLRGGVGLLTNQAIMLRCYRGLKMFSVHVSSALDVGFSWSFVISRRSGQRPKSGDTFLDEITFNFPVFQRRKKKAVR
jgi:hypothetical protein